MSHAQTTKKSTINNDDKRLSRAAANRPAWQAKAQKQATGTAQATMPARRQFNKNTSHGKKQQPQKPQQVQLQQGTQELIQRKIMVGGKPFAPNETFQNEAYHDFTNAYEIIEKLHNDGKPPVYSYNTKEELMKEIELRNGVVEGVYQANKGCCKYPLINVGQHGYLNPDYWVQKKYMDFEIKSPLPPGKTAADAIASIFEPTANTILECFTMIQAVNYYSLLQTLGRAKFNKMFPNGSGLYLTLLPYSNWAKTMFQSTKYETISLGSREQLVPGDWVYFRNFSDFDHFPPQSLWQGENTIVMGPDQYHGFGLSNTYTEEKLNKELVDAFNVKMVHTKDHRTTTELRYPGLITSKITFNGLSEPEKLQRNLRLLPGGLRLENVTRPVISEILKPIP